MTAPMVSIKLKYIVEDVDRHGNVRVYFRRGGRKVRMRQRLGTDEFHRCYADLLGAIVDDELPHVVKPNTLRWLCVQFFGSPEFRKLRARTQYVRRQHLEMMLGELIAPRASETFADFPLARITTKALRVLRDRKAHTPGAADNRVRALPGLFAWALDVEHIPQNPARDLKYLRPATDGWHTWTPDELDQFEAHHAAGSKARLALALLMYTGARRSDVIRLGRASMRDGWIKFRQSKTGGNVELPISSELEALLEGTPLIGAATFLVTEYGKPFTAAGFGNWFRKQCDAAGLSHCTAHGVRKASAARAAENGATVHQLMSIFGWLTIAGGGALHTSSRATASREGCHDASQTLEG